MRLPIRGCPQILRSLEILADRQPDHAQRVQMVFSLATNDEG